MSLGYLSLVPHGRNQCYSPYDARAHYTSTVLVRSSGYLVCCTVAVHSELKPQASQDLARFPSEQFLVPPIYKIQTQIKITTKKLDQLSPWSV